MVTTYNNRTPLRYTYIAIVSGHNPGPRTKDRAPVLQRLSPPPPLASTFTAQLIPSVSMQAEEGASCVYPPLRGTEFASRWWRIESCSEESLGLGPVFLV